MAAELLIGLGLQDIPVLGAGLVQGLVGVLVVHQRATPAVQQVLWWTHDHSFNIHLKCIMFMKTHTQCRLIRQRKESVTPHPVHSHLGSLRLSQVILEQVGQLQVFVCSDARFDLLHNHNDTQSATGWLQDVDSHAT